MKIVSLLQPWAMLVAIGAKKIETRSWTTKYRGPLGIHASKGLPKGFHDIVKFSIEIRNTLAKHFGADPIHVPISCYPRGAIIAICNLVDVRPITADNAPPEPEFSFGDYTPGRFAWILEDIKMLPEPIPAKGQLGLWEFNMTPYVF